MLALRGAPQHESRWARGAGGEELVAQELAKRCPEVAVLHDRRSPGSRANIDHIASRVDGRVGHRHQALQGKVQVAKPLFGKPTLKVNGRDQTKLVDGLVKHVEVVTAVVADLKLDVVVHGALCLVDSELPLLRTLSINDVRIVGRRRECRNAREAALFV